MKFLEILFYFLLFGAFGVAMEVFWTSLIGFIRKKNPVLRGYSSLWMFPIYGCVFFIILLGQTFFPSFNIFIRGLIYTALILTWEYFSGFFLKKVFGEAPWDYSNKEIKIGHIKKKTNFHGLICLNWAWIWYIGSLIAEWLYVFLKNHIIF